MENRFLFIPRESFSLSLLVEARKGGEKRVPAGGKLKIQLIPLRLRMVWGAKTNFSLQHQKDMRRRRRRKTSFGAFDAQRYVKNFSCMEIFSLFSLLEISICLACALGTSRNSRYFIQDEGGILCSPFVPLSRAAKSLEFMSRKVISPRFDLLFCVLVLLLLPCSTAGKAIKFKISIFARATVENDKRQNEEDTETSKKMGKFQRENLSKTIKILVDDTQSPSGRRK